MTKDLCLFCGKEITLKVRGRPVSYCNRLCNKRAFYKIHKDRINRDKRELYQKMKGLPKPAPAPAQQEPAPVYDSLIQKHNESNEPLTREEWIALTGRVPTYSPPLTPWQCCKPRDFLLQ